MIIFVTHTWRRLDDAAPGQSWAIGTGSTMVACSLSMILDLFAKQQMPLLSALDGFSTTTTTATYPTRKAAQAQEQPGSVSAASVQRLPTASVLLHRMSRNRGRYPQRSPLEQLMLLRNLASSQQPAPAAAVHLLAGGLSRSADRSNLHHHAMVSGRAVGEQMAQLDRAPGRTVFGQSARTSHVGCGTGALSHMLP